MSARRELQGVRHIEVDARGEGQRLDNYLLRVLGDVPRSRIYRALRKGEIRVDGRRARPEQKLSAGVELRLPPLSRTPARSGKPAPSGWARRIEAAVIAETDDLLVVNKPPGIAVHGGSGLSFGVIECLRQSRPEEPGLELVHRLDRDTSGLLLISRRPAALRLLHEALRGKAVEKRYLALVAGRWPRGVREVALPLARDILRSGERMVAVSQDGKAALTRFHVLERFRSATLVEAMPVTGRTHQIRVHCQRTGCAILGDAKYSSDSSDALTKTLHLRRLFLHAHSLRFDLRGAHHAFSAPPDEELRQTLARARELELAPG